MKRGICILAGTALLTALSLGVAHGDDVENFYRLNVVTLLVSAAPGGGADIFARAFAPYLAKHIPGEPNIVVSNLPGAGGMVAAIQLQNTLPTDGTHIAMLQRNNFYLPLISKDSLQFDPRSVHWLGSLAKEKHALIVWHDAPVNTLADLQSVPIRIGATGFANENRIFPEMMNRYLGTKFDIVAGYEGNQALGLALERHEIQGEVVLDNNLVGQAEAAWFKDGKIKVVVQAGPSRSEVLPDVINVLEAIEDPMGRDVFNFMSLPLDASRPLAVSANVPPERLQALTAAFDAASADPQFLETMKQMKMLVSPISGKEVDAIIDHLYQASPEVVTEVSAMITQ